MRIKMWNYIRRLFGDLYASAKNSGAQLEALRKGDIFGAIEAGALTDFWIFIKILFLPVIFCFWILELLLTIIIWILNLLLNIITYPFDR